MPGPERPIRFKGMTWSNLCSAVGQSIYTDREMSSFWRNFHRWLHQSAANDENFVKIVELLCWYPTMLFILYDSLKKSATCLSSTSPLIHLCPDNPVMEVFITWSWRTWDYRPLTRHYYLLIRGSWSDGRWIERFVSGVSFQYCVQLSGTGWRWHLPVGGHLILIPYYITHLIAIIML